MPTRPGPAGALHAVFQVSLAAKAAFALIEIVSGVAAYVVLQTALLRLVGRIAHEEVIEGRRDFLTHYLFEWAQGFSISARHFTAMYLLAHGVIKVWLIIGLFRGKTSYYPVAIAVFGGFIVYQLYRFHFTHSIWLIVMTVIDALVIGLTAYEYAHLPQRANSASQRRR